MGKSSDHENHQASMRPEEIRAKREEIQQHNAQLATEERSRLQILHYMHCPKCGSPLTEVQFRGVQVDKCFACGGVYLDDGELEQLTGKPGWFESMLRFFKG
jgi:hypothetical protein